MGNVYQKTYYTDTITLRDGSTTPIYKTITSLEEDGVALTAQSSKLDVDNNPGSYWQDIANSILYIHFSDSGNGAGKTIRAIFSFYLSSEGITFDTNYYLPRILNISPIVNKSSNIFWGASEIGGGNLMLNNGDGFFDVLWEKYIWDKRQITVKLGGYNMDYSQYTKMFVGKIKNKSYQETNMKVAFLSNKSELAKKIPQNVYTTDAYPNIEANAIGEDIPVAFGNFDDFADSPLLTCINTKYANTTEAYTADGGTTTTKIIDLALTVKGDEYYKGWFAEKDGNVAKVTAFDGTTGQCDIDELPGMAPGESYNLIKYNQQQYKIADYDELTNALGSLTQVSIDYDDGFGWREITHANEDLVNGEFTVTTPNDGAESIFTENRTKVKAVFTGKNSDGNSADIVKYLCNVYSGLADAGLDLTSFATSQSDTEMPIRLYLKQKEPIINVVSQIAVGDLAYFNDDTDGKIVYKVYTPERGSTYNEYERYEFFRFIVTSIGDKLRNVINVGHRYNYENNNYHYTKTEDDISKYLYDERESLEINTYIKSTAHAGVLGARMEFLLKQPGRLINFDTGLRPCLSNIGDKIYVTNEEAPNADDGGINLLLCEITSIARDLQNGITKIECTDLRGLGYNVGVYVDDAHPVWDNASDEEKQSSGWYLNDLGFVNDENTEGKDISFYW